MTQNGPDDRAQPQVAADGAAGSTDAKPGGDALHGVIDLLGVLAYVLLVAFFRLVEDAALAQRA